MSGRIAGDAEDPAQCCTELFVVLPEAAGLFLLLLAQFRLPDSGEIFYLFDFLLPFFFIGFHGKRSFQHGGKSGRTE